MKENYFPFFFFIYLQHKRNFGRTGNFLCSGNIVGHQAMLGGQVVNILLSSDALALNDPEGKMADVVTRDFEIEFENNSGPT